MGWRGRGRGMWQGRGPFSDLPPWQRPGWLYGRGACWRLLSPNLRTALPTVGVTLGIPPLTKEQETKLLEQQTSLLQSQLDAVSKRLEELER